MPDALGALTALIQQGRVLWALGAAATHLLGSILMTFAGIGTFAWLKSHGSH